MFKAGVVLYPAISANSVICFMLRVWCH